MPNTITQNLQRLVDAKNAISSAITAKGGTVNSGDGLEEFPADIATIPVGSYSTVKLTSDVPVAIIGSDSRPRVKCSFSAEVTGDYTIQEYGLLYCNNGSHTSADFTISDVDGTNIKGGRLYSSNILDNGTGVVARGYVKVNDQYLYTGNLGGSYADLKKPVLVTKSITENGIYSASADNADGYSQVTVDVSAPAPLSPTRSGATIYDYDGSVIATYTPEEFAALTEYPAHPTHEFLTGDGYNWSLANAKAYAAKYGYVEVGAQYRVTDGKTRLFIRLEEGRLEPQLGLGINGSVDVDWGDGSAHDTMTGSDVSTTVYKEHTYAQAGNYIIALTVTGSVQFNGTIGYGYILGKSSDDLYTNRVYLNALQSLYIGDSVTSIDNSAFYSCYSLASISIPDSVTSIGTNAFNGCYSLTSISIPDSVTSISNGAFNNCCSLTPINIPDNVTSIGANAFQSCLALQSVVIPDGVTSIGSSAFQYCYGLTSINIPDSVTSIGSSAFQSCLALQSVVIPDSVTSIGSSVFQSSHSLTSVNIPDSVTSIGSRAFYFCYGLGFIKFESETPPTVTNVEAWNGIPTDCIIYVPQGTLATYTSATNYPDPETYTYVEY